ncbi:ParB/RepB/Spo0J family partition protein [Massilia alkalitolerans]|uniref:ParB/RepB/Spo0J family partition protein n=1 Tax=Massilia alkalitolerans TaxID=286638 RepID=UPI0006856B1C|nr:ParB N-terminal domain-containing protein [Massilia alkalitolerans]
MSTSKDQVAKAALIDLGDDLPMGLGTPAVERPARTAPGQLMALQGKYLDALAKIAELEKGGNAMELDISRIIRVPGRQRPLSPTERAELKANLDANPLIHPVVVLPETPEGFELFSGYNRVDLYEELGRTKILAVVRDVPRDSVEVLAFYANLLAPSLPDFKKYQGLKARLAEAGLEQKDLAAESGLSTSTISRLMQFDGLPAEALTVLEQNPFVLGSSAAEKLARAAKAGRSELVVEAVKKLAESSSNSSSSELSKAERFTEEKAVAFASGRTSPTARPAAREPVIVKNGKKHFAQLTVRGDQVTVKFSDPTVSPDEWAAKFEEFLKAEIVKQSA